MNSTHGFAVCTTCKARKGFSGNNWNLVSDSMIDWSNNHRLVEFAGRGHLVRRRFVSGKFSDKASCGPKCWNAIGDNCECPCAGSCHGAGSCDPSSHGHQNQAA